MNKKEAKTNLKFLYDTDMQLIAAKEYNNEVLVPQADALRIALRYFHDDMWYATSKTCLPKNTDTNKRGQILAIPPDMSEVVSVQAEEILDDNGVPKYSLWRPFPSMPTS